VQPFGEAPVGGGREELRPHDDGRRDENGRQREEDDVEGSRVADGEEFRVATEQIEERLRDREGGERREMDAPDDAQPARTSFTCATPFGSVIQMR
jgi:hypothetical protein